MSLLISGVEMPENCDDCFMACCSVYDHLDSHDHMVARPHDCPLMELPPHGDLIDREALTERLDGIWDCNDMVFDDDNICERIHADCNSCRWRETRDYITDHVIKHAPTIIEAEGLEE